MLEQPGLVTRGITATTLTKNIQKETPVFNATNKELFNQE